MPVPTLTSSIKRTRWAKAQEYEEAFWRRQAADIADRTRGQLDWYDWKARQLEARLSVVPQARSAAARVLEIGSGPIGIVNALDWGERYAIDPLENFYRRQPSLVELRKPGATYLQGTGERLPFPDGSLSLVIIDNVIDHTYAPGTILDEIGRVLDPAGHLYLSVNVHTGWGAILHKLLALLRVDKGHPHTFTSPSLRRFVARHGFTILAEEIDDYRLAKHADCTSPRRKDRLKGLSGISEFPHMVLCRKTSSGPRA